MNLFGRRPLSASRIARSAKLAANAFAQPDVRMRELQRLFDDATPEALTGALRRLSMNAQGHIADEEEKQWLEDALVAAGDVARAPLAAYIAGADKLTYALRAYRRLAGEAEAVDLCLRTLAAYGPDDYRSSDAKLQLVWQLSESLADGRVLPALVPFLADHGDDVRAAVLSLFERAAADGSLPAATQQAALPALAMLVSRPDVSPRVARLAAELVARHHWALPGEAAVVPALAHDFAFDRGRVLRARDQQVG